MSGDGTSKTDATRGGNHTILNSGNFLHDMDR